MRLDSLRPNNVNHPKQDTETTCRRSFQPLGTATGIVAMRSAARPDLIWSATPEIFVREPQSPIGSKDRSAGHGRRPASLISPPRIGPHVPAGVASISNRQGGPERVIDFVLSRLSRFDTNLEDVAPFEERKAIVHGYSQIAGYSADQLRPVNHMSRLCREWA
jgi:hypothetical protein